MKFYPLFGPCKSSCHCHLPSHWHDPPDVLLPAKPHQLLAPPFNCLTHPNLNAWIHDESLKFCFVVM